MKKRVVTRAGIMGARNCVFLRSRWWTHIVLFNRGQLGLAKTNRGNCLLEEQADTSVCLRAAEVNDIEMKRSAASYNETWASAGPLDCPQAFVQTTIPKKRKLELLSNSLLTISYYYFPLTLIFSCIGSTDWLCYVFNLIIARFDIFTATHNFGWVKLIIYYARFQNIFQFCKFNVHFSHKFSLF